MIDTTMTAVPVGLPGASGAAVRLRAPEAFTPSFQGTGLPVAVCIERSVAPTDRQEAPIAHTGVPTNDVPTNDVPTTYSTTLGIHSPARPQS